MQVYDFSVNNAMLEMMLFISVFLISGISDMGL